MELLQEYIKNRIPFKVVGSLLHSHDYSGEIVAVVDGKEVGRIQSISFKDASHIHTIGTLEGNVPWNY